MCVYGWKYVRSEVVLQTFGLGEKGPDEMCPASLVLVLLMVLVLVLVCAPLVGGGGGGGGGRHGRVGDGVCICVLAEGLRSRAKGAS